MLCKGNALFVLCASAVSSRYRLITGVQEHTYSLTHEQGLAVVTTVLNCLLGLLHRQALWPSLRSCWADRDLSAHHRRGGADPRAYAWSEPGCHDRCTDSAVNGDLGTFRLWRPLEQTGPPA